MINIGLVLLFMVDNNLLIDTAVYFFKENSKYVSKFDIYYLDNLAYKKTTWQTSEVTSSDNAVDGLYTNRTIAGNQCAVSKPDPIEVTWLVDLGVEKAYPKFEYITSFIMIHGVSWFFFPF